MDPNTLTWSGAIGAVGGILGAVGGILGGVFGTYCSIKNTAGPRERAFMIKSAVIGWLFVIVFISGMWLIPSPQRYLLWLLWAVFLPSAIFIGNRRQSQIRREESSQRS